MGSEDILYMKAALKEAEKAAAKVLEFDCDRYDVSFGSEVVERKGGKVGTVYYVDLTVKCPEKNMTLEFLFK